MNGSSELVQGATPREGNNHIQQGTSQTGFIRKVYTVLSLQLLLTTVVTGVCVLDDAVREVIAQYFWIPYVTVELCAISLAGLHEFGEVRPASGYLFLAWAVVVACTIGTICAAFADQEQGMAVVHAEGLVLVVFLLDTLLTFQSALSIFFAGMALPIACMLVLLAWEGSREPGEPHESSLPLCAGLAFAFWFPFNGERMIDRVERDDYVGACIDVYLGIIRWITLVLVSLGECLIVLAAFCVDVCGISCLGSGGQSLGGDDDDNSGYDSIGDFGEYREY